MKRSIPAIGSAVTAILAGLGLLSCDNAAAQVSDAQPAAQVTVLKAIKSCFSSSIPVTGFLVARREAVVQLGPVDKVTEVLAAEGDRVGVDQTLVQVARVTPARPGAEAKTETVALKSPAAGTVLRTTAVVGKTSSPMDVEPLYRVAIDGEIELEAEVPSVACAGGFARARASASSSASRARFPGACVLRRRASTAARSLAAPGSVEVASQLQFAMFARAVINADRSCGISVPRSAVTYRTGGTSVQVVHNGSIETRSVQVGLHSDNDIEVRKGLNEGDLIVANAGTSLRDGDKVTPVDAGTARASQR